MVFACGLLIPVTRVLGQADEQAVRAWLAKLRLVDRFETGSVRSSGPSSDMDSSVAEVPSPARLAELFELVLSPSPSGRSRFYMADDSSRSKARRERLRAALSSAGLLEELLSILEVSSDGSSEIEQAEQGKLVDRLRSFRLILEPQESVGSEGAIQVKRSSANFPLLGWGPGTYQSARSDHFSIVSQAGDKVTAEVAAACEIIFEIWQSLFGDRFEFPSDQTQAFRVVLLRNKEAYVRALKAIEPRISISTGYYSTEHRMAFFYWEGSKSFQTLVHELTHQFFDSTLSLETRFNADSDPGAWALEAIALYMESWSEEYLGGLRIVDVGGWDSPRFQAGRYRRLRDQYWIPWEEFSVADGKKLRSDPDVAAWYSQACGLAHMWLDNDSVSRDRFLGYLKEVYQGQGARASNSLTDDDALRTVYDQYLLTGSSPAGEPNEVYSKRFGFVRRNEIVLARCPVDSRTLIEWPVGLRKLAWLDVGFSQVDDVLFTESGSIPWEISRLNLESTKITDASLRIIAGMKNLTELDLSGCKVTDAGFEALAKHPNLRQLWITNTGITDRSIEVLSSMPKLEKLEASGSLTAEGYQELLRQKPRLKKP